MRRRSFLPAVLAATLAGHAGAGPQDKPQAERPPGHFVPASALQQAVDQRFPLRYPIPGLLDLEVQSPSLKLLSAQNRVGVDLAVQAAGPALNRRHSGTLSLDFALRYEPTDRSIRAHQIHLGRLHFPSLQPGVVDLLNTYGPALAAQSLNEVVLHRFTTQDLALPERLGLQPGAITVVDDGLVVVLVPRPL